MTRVLLVAEDPTECPDRQELPDLPELLVLLVVRVPQDQLVRQGLMPETRGSPGRLDRQGREDRLGWQVTKVSLGQ